MVKLDFQPKLFSTLKNYTKTDFTTDLMAGIIVGIVALPLAIAFGRASGVSPEKGIITAIVAGFIILLTFLHAVSSSYHFSGTRKDRRRFRRRKKEARKRSIRFRD